jgi:hypothetical protein
MPERIPPTVVTFTTSPKTSQFLQQVAEAKGIDVSALLNVIVANALPELRRWLVAQQDSEGLSAIESLRARLDGLERDARSDDGQ